MKRLVLFGAVVIFPLVAAQPAIAQAAINEPGLYSFYHPEGDLLGVGARQIRPGAGAPSANAASALASSAPRASRSHKRGRHGLN
jgi:hypothetical protein